MGFSGLDPLMVEEIGAGEGWGEACNAATIQSLRLKALDGACHRMPLEFRSGMAMLASGSALGSHTCPDPSSSSPRSSPNLPGELKSLGLLVGIQQDHREPWIVLASVCPFLCLCFYLCSSDQHTHCLMG